MKLKRKQWCHVLTNDQGVALVASLIIGLLVMVIGMMGVFATGQSNKQINERKEKVSSFNIAEAGKEHGLAIIKITDTNLVPFQRLTLVENQQFMGGIYSVSCSTNKNRDTFSLISRAFVDKRDAEIAAIYVKPLLKEQVKFHPNGAFTSFLSTNISQVKLDGNNYDSLKMDVESTAEEGILAVANTEEDFTLNGENAAVGSKKNKLTKEPKNKKDFAARIDGGSYPLTPEAALGLSKGILKQFKRDANNLLKDDQCHYTTIQYCTTSVMLTPGIYRGIIIVHDSTYSATCNTNSEGVIIRGVVIADQFLRLNTGSRVHGAVVTLNKSTFGRYVSGMGSVVYSSDIIKAINAIFIEYKEKVPQLLSWQQTK